MRRTRGTGSRVGIGSSGPAGTVESVNGQTGIVTISAAGLGAASTADLAAELVARDDADDAITAALAAHEADTTSIHGITNTAQLELTTRKGAANGYAELDASGLVPSAQLPGFVDDVIEVADEAALPDPGVEGKIYVAIAEGTQWRWSGTIMVEVNGGGLALGETSGTAYRGDRGKTAYDHSQATGNPHSTSIANITGLQAAIDGKQALDTDLTAIAALTSAANKVPYATGSGTWALADLTAQGRALIATADDAATLTALGVSAFVQTLLGAANVAAFRALLELGTAALSATGDFDAAGDADQVKEDLQVSMLTRWEYAGSWPARTTLNLPANAAAIAINRTNSTMPSDKEDGLDVGLRQVV